MREPVSVCGKQMTEQTHSPSAERQHRTEHISHGSYQQANRFGYERWIMPRNSGIFSVSSVLPLLLLAVHDKPKTFQKSALDSPKHPLIIDLEATTSTLKGYDHTTTFGPEERIEGYGSLRTLRKSHESIPERRICEKERKKKKNFSENIV